MASGDDSGEKTEEPSQHRIDEARKKGDVASSKELNSVLILAGTFTTLILSGLFIFEVMFEYMEWLYGLDFKHAYSEEMSARILKETFIVGGKCIGPVFLTSAILGFLAQIGQVGIIFAPEVLQLKLDRINPQQGFKKLFSKKSVGEVVKGLFKFSIVLTITYFILNENVSSFTGFLHTEAGEAFVYGKAFAFKLALSIMAGLVFVAFADFAWEKPVKLETFSFKMK